MARRIRNDINPVATALQRERAPRCNARPCAGAERRRARALRNTRLSFDQSGCPSAFLRGILRAAKYSPAAHDGHFYRNTGVSS
jgi:hypothetical protein